MPVNPIVAQCIQVVVQGFTSNTVPWVNVFNMQNSSPLDQALADVYGGIVSGAYNNLIPQCHSSWSAEQIQVTDLRTAGGPQFYSVSGFPVVGTASGGLIPSQSAGLVSWASAFRGAEGRGRTYLTGFDETASDGEQMDTGCENAVLDWITDMLAISQLMVVSRYKGTEVATSGRARLKPVPRATNVTHLITSGIVTKQWKTQRRRAFH